MIITLGFPRHPVGKVFPRRGSGASRGVSRIIATDFPTQATLAFVACFTDNDDRRTVKVPHRLPPRPFDQERGAKHRNPSSKYVTIDFKLPRDLRVSNFPTFVSFFSFHCDGTRQARMTVPIMSVLDSRARNLGSLYAGLSTFLLEERSAIPCGYVGILRDLLVTWTGSGVRNSMVGRAISSSCDRIYFYSG